MRNCFRYRQVCMVSSTSKWNQSKIQMWARPVRHPSLNRAYLFMELLDEFEQHDGCHSDPGRCANVLIKSKAAIPGQHGVLDFEWFFLIQSWMLFSQVFTYSVTWWGYSSDELMPGFLLSGSPLCSLGRYACDWSLWSTTRPKIESMLLWNIFKCNMLT